VVLGRTCLLILKRGMIMVKRFLTLFLLLSVVSVRAEKAPEKVVSVEEAMK
jgi:hypothetical protein